MKVYQFGIRKLILFVVGLSLLILASCSIPYQPSNRIIPTLSFCQRIQKCERDCKNKQEPSKENCQEDQWIKYFYDELDRMDAWAPPKEWFEKSEAKRNDLKNQIARVAHEYGLDLDDQDNYYEQIFQELPNAADYFFKKNLDNTSFLREGRENLKYKSRHMLLRIDDEHQPLLVKECPQPSDERGSLPRMASQSYPAGISLAVIHPKEKPKAKETSSPQIVINGISEKSPTEVSKPATSSRSQIMIDGINANKENEAPKATEESLVIPVPDFQPVQDITLTLSTVLNSADTLDRLDYVSTFIFLYPYQKPPNGHVDLDVEFWRNFFTRQTWRIEGRGSEQIPQGAKDSIGMDLRYSFDMMRTYFRDVQTTVDTKDLDFGTITRGTTDSISGGVSVSIPAYGATVNPSLNFSSAETSSTLTKLLRQLDQRSSYISPDSNFLRITQRGMINVNLGGRFNEQVQLYVPTAKDTITAIVPEPEKKEEKEDKKAEKDKGRKKENKKKSGKENNNPQFGFSVRSLTQPLYSRVDAMVVSVAVVRHPTKLRPTKDENFGLPQLDVADTDFIVGLPRPSQVTLWKWKRTLDLVVAAELAPNFPIKNNEKIYFDSESAGIYDATPLVLTGFSDTLATALRVKISRAILRRENKPIDSPNGASAKEFFSKVEVQRIPYESPAKNPYYILVKDTITGTAIRLGLLDGQSQEKPKLKPFNADFFKPSQK
jgi:hypothetical protein